MGSAVQSRARVRRIGGVTLLLALLPLGLTAGCTSALELDDVVPRITGLGPVTEAEPDRASVYLWVQDFDSDPVDVQVLYEVSGGKPIPIEIAAGGHGLVGLSSDREWPGQEHLIIWDTTGIAKDAKIRLSVIPDDRVAGRGDTLRTPEFTLAAGLEEPAVP